MDSDFTQLLLRIPTQLKAELQREANIQGRKLTQEVNIRLRESLKGKAVAAYPPTVSAPPLTTDGKPSPVQAQYQQSNAKGPANLSETDQAMLDIFRRMPAQKQLALLSLFN